MIDGYLLNMRVFRKVEDSKPQVLKPLEEAAEIYGAWQKYDDMQYAPESMRKVFREELIDECLNTVQAVANVLAAIGTTQGEADAAIRRMDERNKDRGRLSGR